jgi:hypothetical protein
MAEDHLSGLKSLRDFLVADRRAMVASIIADTRTSGEASGEFVGLQHFIDAVERAISHEVSLTRPDPISPRSGHQFR